MDEDNDLLINDDKHQSGLCSAIFAYLDSIDKRLSNKLIHSDNQALGYLLFIFAFTFNRVRIVFPILLCGFIGYLGYNNMLIVNGYKPLAEKEATQELTSNLGLVFLVQYALCLLAMVLCTQVLKYTIRRQRPSTIPGTYRLVDMRSCEDGTFSMPSGDSSAAAVFCCLVAYEMQAPLVYIILPLVMAGRVYYQCHWFGDTIAGVFIGTFWGIVFIAYFNSMLPLW